MTRGGCRVAVVQADVLAGRPEANLDRALAFLGRAAEGGASLVVFPELYLSGYEVWPRLAALAARPGDATLRRLDAETRRLGLWALVGYPERRAGGIHNVVGLFGPGVPAGPTYSKVHLFGRERRQFARGNRYHLFRLPGITVGVLVCFDLEFPEAARTLALAGAELIAVATANMEPFREAQDVYVRARALENQVFVALANRVGSEGRTRFVGGSGVWDPAGRPLVTADREERVLVATVDAGRVVRERRRFTYLAARRPDTYARRVVTVAVEDAGSLDGPPGSGRRASAAPAPGRRQAATHSRPVTGRRAPARAAPTGTR